MDVVRCCSDEDVPVVEFMYVVFTPTTGESFRRQVGDQLQQAIT